MTNFGVSELCTLRDVMMPDVGAVLFVFFCVSGLNALSTSCKIQAVRPTESTSLTCNFTENINVTRKDVIVKHYVNDTYDEVIVECAWSDGKHDCYNNTTQGYLFNQVFGSDLTVFIPNSTERHEGRYACLVNGGHPSDSKNCSFKMLLDQPTCEIKSVHPTEVMSLTCHFRDDFNIIKKDVIVKHHINNSYGEVILECIWMNEKFECHTEKQKGYMLNHVAAWNLTVDFSNSAENHEGWYQCLINGAQPTSSGICSFSPLPGDRQQQQGGTTTIVISVCVPIALVLIVATIVVTISQRRRLKSWCCQRTSVDSVPKSLESVPLQSVTPTKPL